MADSKFSENQTAGPAQLNLVNSTRLQALRKQSAAAGKAEAPFVPVGPSVKEDAETARLRRQVDQRLQAILAGLPTGKQRSLFKIRYGVALDELAQLPVQQAAAILKIAPIQRR